MPRAATPRVSHRYGHAVGRVAQQPAQVRRFPLSPPGQKRCADAPTTRVEGDAAAHAGGPHCLSPATVSCRSTDGVPSPCAGCRRGCLTSSPQPHTRRCSSTGSSSTRYPAPHGTTRTATRIERATPSYRTQAPRARTARGADACRSDLGPAQGPLDLRRLLPSGVPPNVKFVDLGYGGMATLFGSQMPAAMRLPSTNVSTVTTRLQYMLQKWPRLVAEYKPAFGTIFQRWLGQTSPRRTPPFAPHPAHRSTPPVPAAHTTRRRAAANYTHWGYSDLDIVLGQLPRFIERSELTDYHIVTYSFGDQEAVYLRGQWTVHKNVAAVNGIWMGCDHLGAGLQCAAAAASSAHAARCGPRNGRSAARANAEAARRHAYSPAPRASQA